MPKNVPLDQCSKRHTKARGLNPSGHSCCSPAELLHLLRFPQLLTLALLKITYRYGVNTCGNLSTGILLILHLHCGLIRWDFKNKKRTCNVVMRTDSDSCYLVQSLGFVAWDHFDRVLPIVRPTVFRHALHVAMSACACMRRDTRSRVSMRMHEERYMLSC
jgi:hypothetical protein